MVGRLVEYEQFGIVNHSLRYGYALLFAARELIDRGFKIADAELLEGALKPRGIFVTLRGIFGCVLGQHVAYGDRCAEVGYLVKICDPQIVAECNLAAVGIFF